MRTGIASRVMAGLIVVLAAATAVTAAETKVNLATVNNIYGIGKPGTPVTGGGYDQGGNAYAGDLLGTSLTYNGATFTLSAPGPNSAVSNKVIPLPSGQFATLSFLGSAVNGPQTNQTFIVTYTDSTTSTFTQSIDDFGRVPQNFTGETVITTNPLPLPYKIDSTGAKHNGTYRVFGFSFTLNGAKTVKSLTLPANRNVGVLAVDLIPASAGATSVNLSGVSTLFGISKPGLAFTGGLDNNGAAYAGDQLGTSLVVAGDTYKFASPGANSAVSSATIPLPAGTFSKLTLLGTAVNGTQTNQAFVVTYTDATTTTFTQSLSDWGSTPQNYANESVAKTLTYKILANGSTHANNYKVYAYTFALNSAKTVKSVKLPSNRNVVMISADLIPPAAVTSTSVSLSGASTLFGISKPGLAVTSGGLDGTGAAYGGDLLGTSLLFAGDTYKFAGPGPNSAATSTVVTLPSGKFNKLTVLGTAIEGAQTAQPFIVAYTDGSSTTFTQSLSDWGAAPQNYANETVAKTMSYKILFNGTTQTGTYKLYAYPFTLNSAKTVKSLTLPTNRRIVIVAANLAGGTAQTAAAAPTFSPLPGTFTSGPTITLADTTPGASIYFTTNGTTPTTSSTKYSAPFKISATTTVEAIAVASGFSNSAVVIGAYTVNPTATATATPTFSPTPGTYTSAQNVTLSDSTSGASIFFTTDGSTPTAASTKYTGAIALTSSKTIKAIGIASGHTNSAVATGTYTINIGSGAPSGLSYTTPPPLLIGKSVSLSPTVSGTVTKYAVSPTLPVGLSFNTTTGVIGGTPTKLTASAAYTITASNASGSDTFKLTLQVDSGPRVHLTATATTPSGAGLTYTWKVTDGALTGTNGSQADWELPPGFGLHFAYVMVTDGRGGFGEGRVIVNTDSFGAPQVIPIKALPPAVSSPYQPPRSAQRRLPTTAALLTSPVRPYATGAMTLSGTVLLGDKTLTGVAEPFFGLKLAGASVTTTSTACINDFACPAAVTVNQFGAYSITNPESGAAGTQQTLKATTENATGTSNFTFQQGDLDAGVAKMPTLLISNTATPVIHAMSATFNGTQVGAFQIILPTKEGEPSDAYPQQNWYLSYLGSDDAQSACQYYMAVGAATGCDANNKPTAPITFTAWQKQVRIDNFAAAGETTTTATYVNVVDLNLTRSHHSIRHDDFDMGAYVCNHLGPVDNSGKALSVNLPANTMTAAQQTAVNTAVNNAVNGKALVACVAMDYLSTPVNGFAQFTRFLVFGPSGELLPSVNLDGRGEKFVPGACVACHGGDSYGTKFGVVSSGPDIGSHFLPYDAGNFAFSTAAGLTEAAQEKAIYQLNQNILGTDPTPSVSNLITNWYKAGQVLDKNYVPTAWAGFPDVYQQVIARSCRTCHAALSSFDWDSLGPDSFASFVGDVCDAGGAAGSQDMPNSKVTFDRLWNSAGTSEDQPAKLTSFYHTKGTLASGSTCVLRQPPH